MFRNLLASTAIATLVATGALAQTTDVPGTAPSAAPTDQPIEQTIRAEGHLASNIIGQSVYNGTGDDAQNIGKVNDVILDKEGNAEAIVVGVGGFLGIGQKEVALEYDLAEWAEVDGSRWLVVETTADALKAQEAFDRSAYRPMPADADVAETKPATKEDLANAPAQPEDGETAVAPTDDTGEMATAPEQPAEGTNGSGDMAAAPEQPTAGPDDSGDMAAAPEQPAGEAESTDQAAEAPAPDSGTGTDEMTTGAIDRSTLDKMPVDQLSASNMTGTTVYGANDEDVGEIGDVIVNQDGKIDAIIIDVGGFLGVGEKEVAIGMDNLAFMSDGEKLYLYTELTKEQLEQQPAYDEATYAEKRDEMRMQVQ